MDISQIKTALPSLRRKGSLVNEELYTVWGEEIRRNLAVGEDFIPLSEYPRPQMVRRNFEGQYLNLNGFWNYAIMDDRTLPENFEGKILLPFSPETRLSGVGRQLQPGQYLWYEKRFSCKKPEGMRAILHFGAVDQLCEVFVNGKRVLKHRGGYLPFSAEVTSQIRDGINTIHVCVQDKTDHSFLSRGKQKLKSGGMFYTAQSGIWQTVWLEWVPGIFIESMKITPLYDEHKVEMRLVLNGDHDLASKGALSLIKETVEVTAYEPVNGLLCSGQDASDYCDSRKSCHRLTHEVECISLGTNLRECHVVFEISSMKSWTPQTPYLYGIGIAIGGDYVETYTAMRKVWVDQDEDGIMRIFLNHQPCFMDGVLDQGYYPESLMTPPADDAMLQDILTMKKLGFNMLRKHCKLEPDRWYFHCDRLGMLVWQDIVNGGSNYSSLKVTYLPTLFTGFYQRLSDRRHFIKKASGRLNKRSCEIWQEELAQTIQTLYNHPSLVCYVLFNEGWGQFDSEKACELARELDASRLIDAASGWFDQGAGDFRSEHNYFRKLKVHREAKRSYVLSEYGGYAYLTKDHCYSSKSYGYGIYKELENLKKAFHEQHDRVLSLVKEGLCAAVYTQLSDIEEEINGILTYDRKVLKIPFEKAEK